ncbi:hypothetical protein T12_15014 [Trichinella patagoniensis]|uniref:Uncharacterized protein n=1 Tax=Trichinella patagoniensis TaxID=990121 RepID=A0A0V0YX29_9BILA|nr:hypothetical protein T12_15014 [Trichinella patagoniensis]
MHPLQKFKHLGSVSGEYQFRCFPQNIRKKANFWKKAYDRKSQKQQRL